MSRISEAKLRARFNAYKDMLDEAMGYTTAIKLYRENSMYCWKVVVPSGDSGIHVIAEIGDTTREAYIWVHGAMTHFFFTKYGVN